MSLPSINSFFCLINALSSRSRHENGVRLPTLPDHRSTVSNPCTDAAHVKNIFEPQFDEGMIDYLVMEEKRMNTLKSLAKSYARVNRSGKSIDREPWTADFVTGKGNGLIFLLHGRPGVGKTCTAGESVTRI